MRRLLQFLPVFVPTFFLGLFCAAFLVTAGNPLPDIPGPDEVFGVEIRLLPVSNFGCAPPVKTGDETDGIQIKYGWSAQGKRSFDGAFFVTNVSDRTVYYRGLPNAFDQSNQNSRIKQGGKVRIINFGKKESFTELELELYESVIFWMPVPQNGRPFEAGFSFKVDGREKIIWVKVEQQIE